MKTFKVSYRYKVRDGLWAHSSFSIPESNPNFLREVARTMKSVYFFSEKPGFKFEMSYG